MFNLFSKKPPTIANVKKCTINIVDIKGEKHMIKVVGFAFSSGVGDIIYTAKERAKSYMENNTYIETEKGVMLNKNSIYKYTIDNERNHDEEIQ